MTALTQEEQELADRLYKKILSRLINLQHDTGICSSTWLECSALRDCIKSTIFQWRVDKQAEAVKEGIRLRKIHQQSLSWNDEYIRRDNAYRHAAVDLFKKFETNEEPYGHCDNFIKEIGKIHDKYDGEKQ